ncbi:MAG: hypothetical protein U1B80_03915 [Anaerolineaceae bacterium]|nr:hypothetical protein [Anaerolineaceae bacterium]
MQSISTDCFDGSRWVPLAGRNLDHSLRLPPVGLQIATLGSFLSAPISR